MSKVKHGLKEGFTTGSSATAAAMSALRVRLGGTAPKQIEIPLPVKGTLNIPVERVEKTDGCVRGVVIKDGGDDPDATHGKEIHALVEIIAGDELQVNISGGKGVGTVTLPGLPVAVGEPAINPVPRKQIIAGILKELSESDPDFCGTVKVCIEVPEGKIIAENTMNARLGILGGISILGTQGIVRPFSHASWKASIAQALNVSRASGLDNIVFTTGRRSERFYMEHHAGTSEINMVQAADFFKFSMQQATLKKFSKVRWSLFIGKLVKHAMGFPYTHAKDWAINFPQLSDWCAELGISTELTKEIRTANTARQVFDMIPVENKKEYLKMLTGKARANAIAFSGNKELDVEYFLFDFDGSLIHQPGD
ncbi:cobalt-precorrin-5B (C(1))-methyltransferase CbiD [Maridesulfovibrio hydrothermalis]|uniref:Cobalt-precorrin-5B C(1)-methyltransferase n=1 Tax=Maridesulfovibrio hydrothermalis AM13 = DSM 14728 TaxID=1121451 RepID=L0R7P5_9BACT|nr:cobalt-precorrin-5B (C(1))-methyltransferase CbiD [Maridesulfovibrio hydrothermalis]CCO22753.1 putative cobalt-precorrin-6A synthase [deacetylating] [Maridesulfovibrio hydrothermalis AM13 = DSM 14728]